MEATDILECPLSKRTLVFSHNPTPSSPCLRVVVERVRVPHSPRFLLPVLRCICLSWYVLSDRKDIPSAMLLGCGLSKPWAQHTSFFINLVGHVFQCSDKKTPTNTNPKGGDFFCDVTVRDLPVCTGDSRTGHRKVLPKGHGKKRQPGGQKLVKDEFILVWEFLKFLCLLLIVYLLFMIFWKPQVCMDLKILHQVNIFNYLSHAPFGVSSCIFWCVCTF